MSANATGKARLCIGGKSTMGRDKTKRRCWIAEKIMDTAPSNTSAIPIALEKCDEEAAGAVDGMR